MAHSIPLFSWKTPLSNINICIFFEGRFGRFLILTSSPASRLASCSKWNSSMAGLSKHDIDVQSISKGSGERQHQLSVLKLLKVGNQVHVGTWPLGWLGLGWWTNSDHMVIRNWKILWVTNTESPGNEDLLCCRKLFFSGSDELTTMESSQGNNKQPHLPYDFEDSGVL